MQAVVAVVVDIANGTVPSVHLESVKEPASEEPVTLSEHHRDLPMAAANPAAEACRSDKSTNNATRMFLKQPRSTMSAVEFVETAH